MSTQRPHNRRPHRRPSLPATPVYDYFQPPSSQHRTPIPDYFRHPTFSNPSPVPPPLPPSHQYPEPPTFTSRLRRLRPLLPLDIVHLPRRQTVRYWAIHLALGLIGGYLVFLLLRTVDDHRDQVQEWREWVCPERVRRVVCVEPGSEDVDVSAWRSRKIQQEGAAMWENRRDLVGGDGMMWERVEWGRGE